MPSPSRSDLAREVELSILLVTDAVATISRTLDSLRTQGDPAGFELVLAALAGARLDPAAPELRGFPRLRIVAVDHRFDIGSAEAQALRVATGRWVVFAESCAYPEPGYVDALLRACRTGASVAVGPSVINANPDGATSWAAMTINYARWAVGAPRGAAELLPGHNSAYFRSALQALGGRLDERIQSLTALQVELRSRGGRLWFEPAARVAQLNVSRRGWYLVDQFGKGRQYATHRRRGWTLARRALYLGGSFLLPFVRGARIVATLRRQGRANELRSWRRGLALAAGLLASSAGEGVGYAMDGPTPAGFFRRNLHRARYVRPGRAGTSPAPGSTSAGRR